MKNLDIKKFNNSPQGTSNAPSTTVSLNYIFVIIGTIVGAGFSSGREIAEFFGIFGNFAPLIAIVFGILTFCGLYAYICFNPKLMSKKAHKFFNSFILIASLISLSSMIAGLYSIIEIMFGNILWFWVILFICYFVLTKGINGLSKANLILLPTTILLLVVLATCTLVKYGIDYSFININSTVIQIATYPLLYFGLNIFTCFPISQEFCSYLTKPQKKRVCLFVAIILTMLVVLIQFSILRPVTNYSMHEIPMLMLSVEQFPALGIFTSIAIAIGIITTLLSCGFILQKELNKKISNIHFATLLPLLLGFLLSLIGFSNIVKYAYPITGTFGVILTIYVCAKILKERNKKCNKIDSNLINNKR